MLTLIALMGLAQLPTQSMRCQTVRHVTLCFGDGIILRCITVNETKHCKLV